MESFPVSRPPWFPTEQYPFKSYGIKLSGARVHYLDEGQGPILLMLHGNPTWSFLYRHIVKALRGSFRCIALDYPGFGLSEAPEGYDFKPASHARIVEEFVETLDLKDVTLVVQDWGGPIGMWVATQRPERFSRLVIGNTWAWPADGEKHFERFSGLLGGPIGGFLIRHFNVFVNRFIPAGTPLSKPSDEIMEAYRGPFAEKKSRVPTHVFPREIVASRDFLAEVYTGLARLRDKPAVIVWGDKDVAFRIRELARWQALLPKARTVMLPGAGHYIQEESPGQIIAAIQELHSL